MKQESDIVFFTCNHGKTMQRSRMEYLTQEVEVLPRGEENSELLHIVKEESCDYDNRSCQPVNGVISDKDIETEILNHKDIKTQCIDLIGDDMQVTTCMSSNNRSVSNCLTVWKSEGNEECKTNFTHENGIDRKDMIPEVTDVQKEQTNINNLIVSDSSNENSHYSSGDEKIELLTETSEYLAEKLITTCEESNVEKEAELGVFQMKTCDTLLTCHDTNVKANSSSVQVQSKVELEKGNRKSETFSCDMSLWTYPESTSFGQNKHHYPHGKESNTSVTRNGGINHSIPAMKNLRVRVQRLESETLNNLMVPIGEKHLTGQKNGQRVPQDCSVSGIPDIKSIPAMKDLRVRVQRLESETLNSLKAPIGEKHLTGQKSGQQVPQDCSVSSIPDTKFIPAMKDLRVRVQRLESETLNSLMAPIGEKHLTGQKNGQRVPQDCSVSGIPDIKSIPAMKDLRVRVQRLESETLNSLKAPIGEKHLTGQKSGQQVPQDCSVSSIPDIKSIPAMKDLRVRVQRLESETLNSLMAPIGEKHLTGQKIGQQVPQDCSVSSIPDIKQFESNPVPSKVFVNTSKNSDLDYGLECDHLKQNTMVHMGEKPNKCDVSQKIHKGQKAHNSDDSDRVFATKTNLQCHHKRKDTEEKNNYKCDVCGLGFVHASNLKSHKRTHTGEKPYKCDVCDRNFAQKSDLKVHFRTHSGEKPYICDICDRCFSCTSNLKGHKRTHTGEKQYTCDFCGRAFATSRNLKRHKRIHTGEKPYKCDVCGVDFAQASALKGHIRIHTGEKPYKCDVCDRSFAQKSDLKVHFRTHSGEKPYKCGICGRGFPASYALTRHKRTHTGEKPYKCDVCDVAFLYTSQLKIHKIIHTGGTPDHKCYFCSKVFLCSSNLEVHKRIHTGEKPYQCDVCGRVFTTLVSVECHRRTHTGEKPYKCDVCGKCSTTPSGLQTHKKTHTGETPYKCDVCGKCFAQKGALVRHKRVHTGEKPYKCDVCGVGFTQSCSVIVHKRIHTEEKPYQCDICGAAFAQSYPFQVHKRKHTGGKTLRL